MSRTYELGIVIEPRQSEDDAKAIAAKYHEMIVAAGGTVTEEDHWGKRRLAYPLKNYTEGKYVFFFVASEGGIEWTPVERNLMQNEKILRHLVVRTDPDLKRAATKAKRRKPRNPEDAKEGAIEAEESRQDSRDFDDDRGGRGGGRDFDDRGRRGR
jgi:small subunit ribosomal protein S6